ncbi:hypothetical protein SNEBB_004095 [Seison nebaliae]|nr:hypothetical protein SNEBB_004095 [Seison nebaliae]
MTNNFVKEFEKYLARINSGDLDNKQGVSIYKNSIRSLLNEGNQLLEHERGERRRKTEENVNGEIVDELSVEGENGGRIVPDEKKKTIFNGEIVTNLRQRLMKDCEFLLELKYNQWNVDGNHLDGMEHLLKNDLQIDNSLGDEFKILLLKFRNVNRNDMMNDEEIKELFIGKFRLLMKVLQSQLLPYETEVKVVSNLMNDIDSFGKEILHPNYFPSVDSSEKTKKENIEEKLKSILNFQSKSKSKSKSNESNRSCVMGEDMEKFMKSLLEPKNENVERLNKVIDLFKIVINFIENSGIHQEILTVYFKNEYIHYYQKYIPMKLLANEWKIKMMDMAVKPEIDIDNFSHFYNVQLRCRYMKDLLKNDPDLSSFNDWYDIVYFPIFENIFLNQLIERSFPNNSWSSFLFKTFNKEGWLERMEILRSNYLEACGRYEEEPYDFSLYEEDDQLIKLFLHPNHFHKLEKGGQLKSFLEVFVYEVFLRREDFFRYNHLSIPIHTTLNNQCRYGKFEKILTLPKTENMFDRSLVQEKLKKVNLEMFDTNQSLMNEKIVSLNLLEIVKENLFRMSEKNNEIVYFNQYSEDVWMEDDELELLKELSKTLPSNRMNANMRTSIINREVVVSIKLFIQMIHLKKEEKIRNLYHSLMNEKNKDYRLLSIFSEAIVIYLNDSLAIRELFLRWYHLNQYQNDGVLTEISEIISTLIVSSYEHYLHLISYVQGEVYSLVLNVVEKPEMGKCGRLSMFMERIIAHIYLLNEECCRTVYGSMALIIVRTIYKYVTSLDDIWDDQSIVFHNVMLVFEDSIKFMFNLFHERTSGEITSSTYYPIHSLINERERENCQILSQSLRDVQMIDHQINEIILNNHFLLTDQHGPLSFSSTTTKYFNDKLKETTSKSFEQLKGAINFAKNSIQTTNTTNELSQSDNGDSINDLSLNDSLQNPKDNCNESELELKLDTFLFHMKSVDFMESKVDEFLWFRFIYLRRLLNSTMMDVEKMWLRKKSNDNLIAPSECFSDEEIRKIVRNTRNTSIYLSVNYFLFYPSKSLTELAKIPL